MKNTGALIMVLGAMVFAALSYGFVDPNFPSQATALLGFLHADLTFLVYRRTWLAAGIYSLVIGLFFAGYFLSVRAAGQRKIKRVPRWLILIIMVALLSFPALSYDIFNYILTAKVTFLYAENPYIVMPIEIPHEPMLAYTRAANKLALYGPVWITLSVFPHLLGMGSIVATIFSFKLFAGLFYTAVCYMIYRKSKRWDQTLFFAANPLVIIEVLVNGHNDITMMALALAGLILWQRKRLRDRIVGIILLVASVFIKGATVVLLPLVFFTKITWEKKMTAAYWLIFGVFLISPLREEMYPWYGVWWIIFAALIPMGKKLHFIHGFSYSLSLGLMLRYIPWIGTREYGGITPVSRIILMLLPVVMYVMISKFPFVLKSLRRTGKRI